LMEEAAMAARTETVENFMVKEIVQMISVVSGDGMV
jgi:hypothetical protein